MEEKFWFLGICHLSSGYVIVVKILACNTTIAAMKFDEYLISKGVDLNSKNPGDIIPWDRIGSI